MHQTIVPRLDRPAPPYRQMADHYRDLIETGVLTEGDRLPTIIQMAAEWRVSPGTAHKAARVLRDSGLVRTTRQGTTVGGAQ